MSSEAKAKPRKGAPAAACPFCGKEVGPQLVLYGGSCPHCFGEIPGEEAPTDPGEEKKRAEIKAAAKVVKRSMTVPLALMLLILLVPLSYTLYSVFKPHHKAVLNLDDAQYNMGDLAVYAAPPQAANPKGPDPKVDPTSPAHPAGSAQTVASNGNPKAPGSDLLNLGVKMGDPTSLPGVNTPQVGPDGQPTLRHSGGDVGQPGDLAPVQFDNPDASTRGGVNFGNLPDAQVERRGQTGVVLQDDNAIVEMIMKVVSAQTKLLKSCYEERLKQDETLEGRWLLEFTVTTEGKVSGAKATGANRADPQLEQCLADKVSKWQFQPIKADEPIQKSVAFKPSM